MPNCVKPGEVALFLTFFLLFSALDILNTRCGQYWPLHIHFLAINIVKPGEVASFLTSFPLVFFHSIINTRCGLYWSLSIHFLVISIVPNENMMVDCQLSDLVFEVSHDFSGIICILQFVLMKCITAPNVTLFSRSTRISRRPGALSRSPMVASLDSQKCH